MVQYGLLSDPPVSLPDQVYKLLLSFSRDKRTPPPHLLQGWKGESPDGEDASGSLFGLPNYPLIFKVNRSLANNMWNVHIMGIKTAKVKK